jgi:S-formylglutathione hydrolase FrmB
MPAHNFEQPRGKLVHLHIDSDALSANLVGDPSVRTVAVYLPPGYDDSDATYPMFVDLAGFAGSGIKRLSWTAFGESVPQRLDRLVASGAMGPVIAVFPDCFTSLGGNQYIDSVALGRWEGFLVDDLVPRIEAEFRVRRGRLHRAVYGKSSGGYGAIVHGMRHATTWGAVACHSGDMGFDWVYRRDFPGVLDILARYEGSVEKLVESLRAKPKIEARELHALMILAMAATYDPDPDSFCGIRLPVDIHTCELDEARWAQWLQHDPLVMVELPASRENLRRLSGIFIDCGRHDQYTLHYGARAFVRKLERFEIPHSYEEFDDNHSSIDYRLDVSLPFLYGAVTHDVG